MRTSVIFFFFVSLALAAPVDKVRKDVAARKGDEDDGVGWFVAVPALMKPAPGLNINVPIPGIPCKDKKY